MKYQRYPAYKDSGVEWIGEIPNDWVLIKLKWAMTIMKGKVPKNIETDISETNIYLPYLSMEFLRGETPKQWVKFDNSTFVVDEGETLLLWDGSNAGEFIKSRRGILSSTVALVHSNKVNHNFLFYFCKAAEHKLKELTVGMGIPHVDGDLLKSLSMPFPLNEEQVSIGNFLDCKTTIIDRLVLKEQQIINLLKEKRQAIITHAVTKGLDPNVPMKDSGVEWIGEIPEHWKVMKIKFTSYVKGRVGWKGLTSEEYLENGYAYLVTGQDFQSKTILWDSCYCVDKGRYYDDPYIQLKNGDLLITKDGTIGKLAIVNGLNKPACLNSGIFLVRPCNYYITDFLYYVLSSSVFSNFYFLRSFGSTIQHLYQNIFEEFSFPIPSIEEQDKIVAYLEKQTSKIDKIISLEERMVQLLKEYKVSLISQAVTGKIDVRGLTVPVESNSSEA